jgi:hypothetical protein
VSRGLDCTFDGDFPVTVGRPTGLLSIASAAVLRGLVLKALTGAADLVVLDVSRLRVHEDIALAVFPALAKQAAASWGATLRICAPGPAFAAALDRMAVCRYVPVHRSATQAIRAHERRPAPVRLHHTAAAPPGAARRRPWTGPGRPPVRELGQSCDTHGKSRVGNDGAAGRSVTWRR